jgi:DNA repair exonuclease SbcCD ATPase subunit
VRIKSVRLAWFRGAAEPVSLAPDAKSMVVYGPNGAGKSSFVDAVEYVVHNGKLAHLTHEYSGRNQEKAIPNTHTPADASTEFRITFANEEELQVKVARDGSHTKAGADAAHMSSWDYRRTVLRQDELAEFIRSRKGEKYSALLPMFGLHELEIAAENLRQLHRAVEQQSKLAQQQGALGQRAIKRKHVFGEATDAAIERKISELHRKYCPNSDATAEVTRCQEVAAAISHRTGELSTESQRYVALRTVVELHLIESVKTTRDANAKLAGSVEPLVGDKLEVLQAAGAFAARLPGQGEVDCPVCGRPTSVDKFKEHVKAEHKRLDGIIAAFQERRAAVSALIEDLKTLKKALTKADLKEWRDELKRGVFKPNAEWLEQSDAESLRQSLTEDDLNTIEKNCLAIIESAAAASQEAPPDIKGLSAHGTAIETAQSVIEAKGLAEDIARIDGILAFINALEAAVREEIRERSEAVIKELSEDIGKMWKALHPGDPIEEVRLYLPEDDKAIDISLKFHGKGQDSPRLTLSEGYRNSLGLCVFLAMTKREAANDRPLFLDDVVVSLDRNHRGMVVQLLEDEFENRQVILFTHDRDWYAELRQQLDDRRWKFKALLPYETPQVGIRWSDKTTTFDDARAQLKDRPAAAGNDARKIMDVELAIVAERLQIRLPYLRGDKNDRRMWSEFLDRLKADGKICLQKKLGSEYARHADGLELLDRAGRLLATWGNKASHSPDVVRPEAGKLIDACEEALEVFRCASCSKPVWYADVGSAECVQCHCGELRWRYGKG